MIDHILQLAKFSTAFKNLTPEKNTPFGRSLPVWAIIGSNLHGHGPPQWLSDMRKCPIIPPPPLTRVSNHTTCLCTFIILRYNSHLRINTISSYLEGKLFEMQKCWLLS